MGLRFSLARPRQFVLSCVVMLSISKTQKAALQSNDETWVQDLCSHLRDYHSTAVSGLKDDELRTQVAKGLEKARGYKFSEPSSIAFFIALLFEIGPKFDESPGIQEIMKGEGTPDERLYELMPRFPMSEMAKREAAEKVQQEPTPMDESVQEAQPIDASAQEATPMDESVPEAQPIDASAQEAKPVDVPVQEAQPIDASAQEAKQEKAKQEAWELFLAFYNGIYGNTQKAWRKAVDLYEGIWESELKDDGPEAWVEGTKRGRPWEGEKAWGEVWAKAAGNSPPKNNLEHMDVVAYAASRADRFQEPKIVKSCDPPKKQLENVSALFIPFEAVGKFYKGNALKGVLGLKMVQSDDGKELLARTDNGEFVKMSELGATGKNPEKLTLTDSGDAVEKLDIKGLLPDIVKAECENIRRQYSNEPSREAVENRCKDHPVFKTRPELTEQQRKDLFTKFVNGQMGYQHYPTILILSENPTKIKGQDPKSTTPKVKDLRDDFPTRIDTGESGVVYVQELALDNSKAGGIAAVNEMAVYVREDFKKRAQESGELSITTEALTRHAGDQSNVTKNSKNEYMVKVTIRRPGYSPSSLLGVHLRATLTGVKAQEKLQKEIESLDKFCKDNDIDVVVGDFNFNVGVSPKGFRGVHTESGADEWAKQVEYWTPDKPAKKDDPMASPVASFPQSYSSSNNENFYMGIYLANPDNVRLTGPGMIGLQGASGARSLPKGKGKKPGYYSDHGSMFFEVEQAPMPIVGVGQKRKRSFRDDEPEHDESEDELPALKKPKQ